MDEKERFFSEIYHGFHPQNHFEKGSNPSHETTTSHNMNDNQKSLMKKVGFSDSSSDPSDQLAETSNPVAKFQDFTKNIKENTLCFSFSGFLKKRFPT